MRFPARGLLAAGLSLSFLLATASLGRAASPTTTTTVAAVRCGDVNGDGIVNIGDALVVAQFDVGLRLCGQLAHPEACDVNGDGACNIGDALRMAQCDVGLISCAFTCGPFTCPSTTSTTTSTTTTSQAPTTTTTSTSTTTTQAPTTTTSTSTTTSTTSAACGPPTGMVVKGSLTATPGRFNYNLTLGLPGANSACNTHFSGSHACTLADLQRAPASDLACLKDTAGMPVTSFWAIASDAATTPSLQQCEDDVAGGSGLNWEYATAHTASRGQKVSLDNTTGALGAVQSSVQCNISGNAWVGCCQ